MMNQILPLLNSYLPVHYAIKGLEKTNPALGSFISNASAAGYATDAILGFLRDKFDSEGAKTSRSKLESKVASNQARIDEEAALAQIKQARMPGDILQKGASTIAGLGAGLKRGSVPKEEEKPMAQVENPLQVYAPKAHEFVLNAVNSGNDSLAALQHAQSLFKGEVSQALKKSKMGLEDIAQFYESSQRPMQQEQSQAQPSQPQAQQAGVRSDKIAALQQAIMEIRKLRGG